MRNHQVKRVRRWLKSGYRFGIPPDYGELLQVSQAIPEEDLHCIPRPARYNPFFDAIVKRESQLRFADRLKNTLLREPDWMALSDDIQAKRGDHLGKMRISHFVRTYPCVFEFAHDVHRYKWLRFTPLAQALLREHKQYKREYHKQYVIEAVAKLLMMSKHRRLERRHVSKLGRYFAFPVNYEMSIFYSNPGYFRPVVDKNGKDCIELTHWHGELAVTAREKWLQAAGISNPYAFPEPGLTSGDETVPDHVRSYFDNLQKIPFPSPYEDSKDLVTDTPSALKRQLATYHEILSLSLEKRFLVRSFSHELSTELGLQYSALNFFSKHEPLFYVSHAGEKPWVFLREAYDGFNLKEKHPLWHFKERFFALCMNVKDDMFDKREKLAGAQHDLEDSDVEVDEKPYRARLPVPLDNFDFDGWCMS